MKTLVANVQRTHGVSKTNGKPYDMHVITVLMPLQNVSQGNYNVEGYGTVPAEMVLDPAILHKFKNLKDPSYLDLTVEQVLMFGEIKNIVTDATPIQPVQKAANG